MSDASPDISARFALLIAGLCRVVAAHIAQDRTAAAWIVLVWSRLRRIGGRVERLAAQVRTGTVPKLRAGFTLAKPRKPAIRPPIVLAGKPAWLIRTIQPTAVYGELLRRLLDDPEMAALLAAAPQLVRILRPLCRALGVAPPVRPPRPERPDPESPAPDAPAPESRLESPAPAAAILATPAIAAAPASRTPPARARRMASSEVSATPGTLLKPA